jgi:hypothetical protein
MAPDYVSYADGNFDKFGAIWKAFQGLKVGQKVLTKSEDVFVIAKVSSIRPLPYDADGPCVRVSNGEYSWRVDGCDYAYPIAA